MIRRHTGQPSNRCRWDMLRLRSERRSEDAITGRWQRQLCRSKNLREIVPGARQPWGLRETWVAGRLT